MQRGTHSIYNTLFADEYATSTVAKYHKGRSTELVTQRNQLLCCRYYYYAKLMRKLYPDTLRQLKTELFIEERTMVEIIQRNSQYLHSLKNQQASTKFFKNLYPFMVW